MNNNFGKYDIPPTLQILLDIKNKVGYESFDRALHFNTSLDNFRYFNTPMDVVIFGTIGVDGIHYGFLTDFSQCESLEDAPIVCVSPMDFDRPTCIIANNLREFLALNLDDSELFYNYFKNEEDYLNTQKRWAEEWSRSPYQPTEAEKQTEKEIRKMLLDRIDLPTINNPYQHIKKVEQERLNHITINTQDHLGVIAPLPKDTVHLPFPVDDSIPDLEELKEFFLVAPLASKQVLFRDIQSNSLMIDHEPLLKIVFQELKSQGLYNELNRLIHNEL